MRVEEEEPYGLKNELVRSIVKAKFERGENFHYRWVPLSCVREVDRLRGWVMRGLDAIACPTLIMHAHEDELTSARSAHFLRDGIADSRLVLLDNSYHMICVDNDRDRVAAEVLRFMDRVAEASQPSRLQSLEGEDAQRLLSTYRESLRAGEFETLFPLFAENVVWTEEGDSPLSGVYRGKSALIDLFSRLMDYSRNTLRILEVGAPEPRGRAFAMPLRFQVQDGPGLQESGATHTLRLRANVITRVNSVADDPPRADALWRRLAAASGVEPEADAMDPQTLAIPAEELADAFEAAMIELRTLQQPPSAAVQIRLQAYEWQVRRGDARPKRPRTLMPAPGAPRRLAAAGGPARRPGAAALYRPGAAAGRGRLTPARPYTTATRPGANCRRENRPRIRPCPATTPRPATGPPRAAAWCYGWR